MLAYIAQSKPLVTIKYKREDIRSQYPSSQPRIAYVVYLLTSRKKAFFGATKNGRKAIQVRSELASLIIELLTVYEKIYSESNCDPMINLLFMTI